MLTVEVLRASDSLKSLTDEQLKAIAELSRNDEEVVIGKRIGELHGSYDNDIRSATGVEKNSGEKSYDYLKRVLSDYREKSGKAEKAASDLKEKAEELERIRKAQSGDTAELLRKIGDAKSLNEALKTQLAEANAKIADTVREYSGRMTAVRVDSAFDSALGGLVFRKDIPESVIGALKEAAKAEVKAKGSIEFDETSGAVVLRNAAGDIVRNPANNMNPYTIPELLLETSVKDVLQKPAVGAGSSGGGDGGGGGGGGGGSDFIDLSPARTQIEADKIISDYLAGKGLAPDSPEYWSKMSEIRSGNRVAELPIR